VAKNTEQNGSGTAARAVHESVKKLRNQSGVAMNDPCQRTLSQFPRFNLQIPTAIPIHLRRAVLGSDGEQTAQACANACFRQPCKSGQWQRSMNAANNMEPSSGSE
jgi:hypothetical protein